MTFMVVSLLAVFLLLPASYGRGQYQTASLFRGRSSCRPPLHEELAVGALV